MKKLFIHYGRQCAAVWGILGIVFILTSPIYRLSQISWPVLTQMPLAWYHLLCLVVSVGFMAYAEGYKGFQLNFSPRVVARARYLQHHAGWFNGLLAPLFCMAYFGATKRRQIASFILTSVLVLLIYLVSYLPQPWRMVVDAGVIIGLIWGVVSVIVIACIGLRAKTFPYDAELAPHLQENRTHD